VLNHGFIAGYSWESQLSILIDDLLTTTDKDFFLYNSITHLTFVTPLMSFGSLVPTFCLSFLYLFVWSWNYTDLNKIKTFKTKFAILDFSKTLYIC